MPCDEKGRLPGLPETSWKSRALVEWEKSQPGYSPVRTLRDVPYPVRNVRPAPVKTPKQLAAEAARMDFWATLVGRVVVFVVLGIPLGALALLVGWLIHPSISALILIYLIIRFPITWKSL
jgi:hypothetical protein